MAEICNNKKQTRKKVKVDDKHSVCYGREGQKYSMSRKDGFFSVAKLAVIVKRVFVKTEL